MPNIDDDIRKAGKRLKALRKTASAHNKANRIFVYKRAVGVYLHRLPRRTSAPCHKKCMAL